MFPAQKRLRTPEAAAYLGLSPSTLEKLRLYGGGPVYYKSGPKIRQAARPFSTRGGVHGSMTRKLVNPAAWRRGPGSGSSVVWRLPMPEKIPPHNKDFKRRVSLFRGGVR